MCKRKFVASTITALGLTLVCHTIHAAEPIGAFSRIEGFAVVSQGGQYIQAHEGMALSEGDRLMVLDGGKATIAFKDGCQYVVADDELLSIGATSTCAAKGTGSLKIDPYTAISQTLPASPGFQLAAFGPTTGVVSTLLATAPGWVVPVALGTTVLVANTTVETGSDTRDTPSN